jgi:Protein of unknown function (DUF3716)
MYIKPEIIAEEYRPQTPEEWVEQALLHGHSASAESMAKMELLRGVKFRPGRVEINLFKPQNCEAALAYSHGQVMEGAKACRSCKTGRGPFAKCVLIKAHLKESCSNCHYNSEGTRCSFRSLGSIGTSPSTIAKQTKAPESRALTVSGTQNYQADQNSMIISDGTSRVSLGQAILAGWARLNHD